jgi:hypothetical protein
MFALMAPAYRTATNGVSFARRSHFSLQFASSPEDNLDAIRDHEGWIRLTPFCTFASRRLKIGEPPRRVG